MNPKKKNQHFVPKFYLRNFSYLNNDKQIGLYNTRTKFYFKTAPLKSQGSRDFFYGVDGVIENNLAEIEGHLSTTIKQIIKENLHELNQEDHYRILLFIVLTDLRNPSRINGFLKMIHETRAKLLEESPETVNIDELLPLPTHEECVRSSLENYPGIVEGIRDLKYKILFNTTDTPFLTSDNPVVKYNQFLEWKRWKQSKTGYGSAGLQIFIPLNPEITFLLFDANSYDLGNERYNIYQIRNSEDVDQLNLLQFINCIETIYFNDKIHEAYVKEISAWADEFPKANIPFAELKYLIENNVKPEKKNLVVNGVTECEISLSIKGLKIRPIARQRKLTNTAVQPRLGSNIFDQM